MDTDKCFVTEEKKTLSIQLLKGLFFLSGKFIALTDIHTNNIVHTKFFLTFGFGHVYLLKNLMLNNQNPS